MNRNAIYEYPSPKRVSSHISTYELANQVPKSFPDRKIYVLPQWLFVVEKFAHVNSDGKEGNNAGDQEKSPEAVDAQTGGRQLGHFRSRTFSQVFEPCVFDLSHSIAFCHFQDRSGDIRY